MKAISLTIFIFVYGQILSQSVDTLDFNNTRALISGHGNFFHYESNTAGEEITQTYAFVYYRNGSRLQNVDGMQLAVQELHSYYDSIAYGDCSIAVASLEEEKSKNLKVYPNPVTTF